MSEHDIIPYFLTFCSSDQSLLSFLNFNILVNVEEHWITQLHQVCMYVQLLNY